MTGKIEMYTTSPFWLKYQIPDCVISKCVGKRASCGYAFFIQGTRIRKSAIVSKSWSMVLHAQVDFLSRVINVQKYLLAIMRHCIESWTFILKFLLRPVIIDESLSSMIS